MGFHLRGYTFLCDQGFGSYGQNKFWVQYIKYRRVQRNRRARACAGGPLRARTPPHMTSEVMLSAFIRIYPRACDIIIRVYPCVIIRVQPQGRLLQLCKLKIV